MRKLITIFFIFLLFINFIYVLIGVLFKPVISMDSLGIWLLKAKAIFMGKDYFLYQLSSPEYSYSSQDYPILLPFLFSLIYKLAGGVQEKLVLLPYPFLYLLILFFAYKIFRIKTSVNLALFFTYAYSIFSPLLAQAGREQAGNADILIVFLSWLTAYLLLTYSSSPKIFLLLTIITIIASQIKFEGLFLVFFLFVIPSQKKLKFILFSLLPFLSWTIAVKILMKPPFNRFYLPNLIEIVTRSKIIILGIMAEMLNYKNWYVFWLIFLLCLFFKKKFGRFARNIIIPYLYLSSASFFIIYLLSSTPTEKYVPCSIGRVFFQLSPWFFLLFFEKTFPEIKKTLKRFVQFL